jgi:hypothetical protein
MSIKIVISVTLVGYILFRLIRSFTRFSEQTYAAQRAYAKYKDNDSIDSLYKKANLAMLIQNFQIAWVLFHKVKLKMLSNPTEATIAEMSNVDLNIDFCQKPLPWINGTRNKQNSYFTYFMLERFGGLRSYSYPGINEDMNSAIEQYYNRK